METRDGVTSMTMPLGSFSVKEAMEQIRERKMMSGKVDLRLAMANPADNPRIKTIHTEQNSRPAFTAIKHQSQDGGHSSSTMGKHFLN